MSGGDQVQRTAESVFLGLLFEALASEQIRYAVMRNWEPLPYSTGGSDLDILVAPEQREMAKDAVLRAIHAAGGVAIGAVETAGFLKIHAFGMVPTSSDRWWGLCLDLNFGLYYRGHRLVAMSTVLPIRLHNRISVLTDSVSALLGVLKEVLNNATLPEHYLKAARSMAQDCGSEITGILAPMGHKALAALQNLLLLSPPRDAVRQECSKVRNLFLRESLFRQPIKFSAELIAYEWSRPRRYLKPPGMVVAILGVDGAGKSTIIEAVKPVLNAATHGSVFVQHLRPGWLPPLARLKGGGGSGGGQVVEPHGSKSSGVVGSLFRMCYLLADYVLGYWLVTRIRIARDPAVVLFDRYAYDMALDPTRFRIGVPGSVAARFAALAPKPDLIICLYGSPEIIAERKKELPLIETRRQINALRRFASRERRARLISTDLSVEESRDALLRSLWEYLQD